MINEGSTGTAFLGVFGVPKGLMYWGFTCLKFQYLEMV